MSWVDIAFAIAMPTVVTAVMCYNYGYARGRRAAYQEIREYRIRKGREFLKYPERAEQG